MAPRKKPTGPKFFRNLRPNRVRVMDVDLDARGSGEDFAEVSPEVYGHRKFARSIGLLIEEISPDEYDHLMDEDSARHANGEPAATSMTYIDQDGNEQQAALDTTEVDQDSVYTVQIDDDGVAQYPGASHMTKGRPTTVTADPSKGVVRRGR